MTTRLEETKQVRALVALIVQEDPAFLPIFTRLDHEAARLESNDPVAAARALAAHQRAMA